MGENIPVKGRVKAALFDLDDTLCDDASAWVVCARKSAEIVANHAPGFDPLRLAAAFLELSRLYWFSEQATQETRTIFEVRSAQWQAALAAEGHDPSPRLADQLAEEYGSRRSSEIALFADAVPTLTALRKRGILVAIVSNGFASTHLAKVANLGLRAYVDHVVLADVFGRFKPDARIFQHALDLCKCAPEEAVMIGDDLLNDIGGAEAAGIRSYWFNPHHHSLPTGAPVPSGGQIAALSDILSQLS